MVSLVVLQDSWPSVNFTISSKSLSGSFIRDGVFSSPSPGFLITALLIDEFARKESFTYLETALCRVSTPCLYGLGRNAFTFMVQRDYVAGSGTPDCGGLWFCD